MFFIISIKKIHFVCRDIYRHEDRISFLSEAKESWVIGRDIVI